MLFSCEFLLEIQVNIVFCTMTRNIFIIRLECGFSTQAHLLASTLQALTSSTTYICPGCDEV